MKPEEQTIAIAESVGWKWIQTNFEAKSGFIGTDSPHSGNIPYQGRNYPSNAHLPTYGKAIPDYLNDLNAMHDAMAYLDPEQMTQFASELSALVLENPHKYWWDLSSHEVGHVANATAKQRAEAFLKTLGLWKP